MPRRLLTAELVDSVERPEVGEIWIADTAIRGFGLRVWASATPDFKAFAVRKNDRNGRTVRKTFRPWQDGYNWRWSWNRPEPGTSTDESGQIRLGAFIKVARSWAQQEIDIIVGRQNSDEVRHDLRDEHHQMRERIGAILSQRTLGHLVETMLTYGEARGWKEGYRDRLRHAFNLFDQTDAIRATKIADLVDGRLVEMIYDARLSPGNLRLLRSLFKAIFWNVHEMGGPPIGTVLPRRLSVRPEEHFDIDAFHENLSKSKLEDLFHWLKHSNANWRFRCAIALSCLLWSPVSRVLSAQWSQIVDDRWYPYGADERTYWWAKAARIDREAYNWLLVARQGADEERVESEFWFPRSGDPTRSIANVDHVWLAAIRDLDWPITTLREFSRHARRGLIGVKWPSQKEQTEIAALLATWPGIKSSA